MKHMLFVGWIIFVCWKLCGWHLSIVLCIWNISASISMKLSIWCSSSSFILNRLIHTFIQMYFLSWIAYSFGILKHLMIMYHFGMKIIRRFSGVSVVIHSLFFILNGWNVFIIKLSTTFHCEMAFFAVMISIDSLFFHVK